MRFMGLLPHSNTCGKVATLPHKKTSAWDLVHDCAFARLVALTEVLFLWREIVSSSPVSAKIFRLKAMTRIFFNWAFIVMIGRHLSLQQSHHLVRRCGYYYRYDTDAELTCLNELWVLVNERLNFFVPTKKPLAWSTDAKGRRKRLYDAPATPFQRLVRSRILNPAQERELRIHKDTIDLAIIAKEIDGHQQRLIRMAAEKTRVLQEATTAKLPDRQGIRIRKNAG